MTSLSANIFASIISIKYLLSIKICIIVTKPHTVNYNVQTHNVTRHTFRMMRERTERLTVKAVLTLEGMRVMLVGIQKGFKTRKGTMFVSKRFQNIC